MGKNKIEKNPTGDRIAELYLGRIFTKSSQDSARKRIHWMLGRVQGNRVLDIGCSQGIASILIAREGKVVVGLDPQVEAIRYAKKLADSESREVRDRIQWVVGDTWSYESDLGFDSVIVGEVIEHQASPLAFLRSVSKYVSNKGNIILTTPFALKPHLDHKISIFPSDMINYIQGLDDTWGFERMEIEDSYIRCVISRDKEKHISVDLASLLMLEERGIIEFQRALYDELNRKSEVIRKQSAKLVAFDDKIAAMNVALDSPKTKADRPDETNLNLKASGVRQEARNDDVILPSVQYKALSADYEAALAELKEQRVLNKKLVEEVLSKNRDLVLAREEENNSNTRYKKASMSYENQKSLNKQLFKTQINAEERRNSLLQILCKENNLGRQLLLDYASRNLKFPNIMLLPFTIFWRAYQIRSSRKVRSEKYDSKSVNVNVKDCSRYFSQRVTRAKTNFELSGFRRFESVVALDIKTTPIEAEAVIHVIVKAKLRPDFSGKFGIIAEKNCQVVESYSDMFRIKLYTRAGPETSVFFTGEFESLAFSVQRTGAPIIAMLRVNWDADLELKLNEIRGNERSSAAVSYAEKSLPKNLESKSSHAMLASRETNSCTDYLESLQKHDAQKKTVLCLMDIFSEECFKYEFNYVPLCKQNWKAQISEGTFDLFLAESAWRGNNGDWSYCLSNYGGKFGRIFSAVLAEIKRSGMPTVFWNKEDPVNYDVFIEAAKDFDYVFTTDEGCVEKYKKDLGHDRIAVLPFAAQMKIHNPVLAANRVSRVAFAGSWHGVKYPNRAKAIDDLFSYPMNKNLLDIYDRHSESTDERLAFPKKYKRSLRGSVPYSDISDVVYKKYSFILNVNSVDDSSSMVARRIYELAACGTPVISSSSPAISKSFSDSIMQAADSADVKRILEHSDPLETLRRAVRGVRTALTYNTYQNRVAEIFKTIGSQDEHSPEAITCILVSKRPKFLRHIAAQLNQQVYSNIKVIFVSHGPVIDEADVLRVFNKRFEVQYLTYPAVDTVLADGLNLALSKCKTDFVAKIDDDDFYGPNYISDQVLALRYSSASVVGKSSYFVHLKETDQTGLRFKDKHYRFMKRIHGGTLVWSRLRVEYQRFDRVIQGTDSLFLKSVIENGGSLFSSDPFNFIHVRYDNANQHTWKISNEDMQSKMTGLVSGIDFDAVYT